MREPTPTTQLEFPQLRRPESEALARSGRTQFVELPCRSVLNWVTGARMGEFYSLNPYRGCEFGCVYCYARYTHEFLERDATEEFEHRVYVKTNAPEVFLRDLKRASHLASGLHIGSATDPYQPAEARFSLTRRLLEKLLPFRGIPVSIATKSALVARDVDLLAELSKRHPVKVVMTCVTLDESLRRELEPCATPTRGRLAALEKLSRRGIETGLLLAPVLPGITDREEDLSALCRAAREAGVRTMMYQVLFLPGASKKRFFPWLETFRPDLHPRYVKVYRGRDCDDRAYRDRIRDRVARARAAAGLESA